MNEGKRRKTLQEMGFQPISYDDYLQQGQKEVVLLHKKSRVQSTRNNHPHLGRRPLGRPPLQRNINEELHYEPSSEGESDSDNSGKGPSNRPGNYVCWFTSEYWLKIEAALQLHGYKHRAVVRYLKRKYIMPTSKPMFERLNESTLRGWFERDGKTLKPRPAMAVEALKRGECARNVIRPGLDRIWARHRETELEFIDWMLQLRNTDCGLNSLLIAFQMKAWILARAPSMLVERGGHFKVSRGYVRRWARERLGWSFRKPTSTASNLPMNWEEKRDLLLWRIAYLIYCWEIPMSLVVNGDQTGVHLLPVGNERTYTAKGARDVTVAGRGDKRQITCLLSCSAEGEVLPGQLIFEGKTTRSLPKGRQAQRLRLHGWHLTYTAKHWSTLATMQEYVRAIFVPYVESICRREGLDFAVQRSILLLDSYSVHTGSAFRDWMRTYHPLIHLVFVPGNCTSKLQPCDVVIQRPFKAEIHKQFADYAVHEISSQLASGMDYEALQLDTHIGPLRNELCGWIVSSWLRLGAKKAMIRSGWGRIGLLAAWEKETQLKAVRKNMECVKLFDPAIMVEVKEEDQYGEDNTWYGEANVDEPLALAGDDSNVINLDDYPDADDENVEEVQEGENAEEVREEGENEPEKFAQEYPDIEEILSATNQLLAVGAVEPRSIDHDVAVLPSSIDDEGFGTPDTVFGQNTVQLACPNTSDLAPETPQVFFDDMPSFRLIESLDPNSVI